MHVDYTEGFIRRDLHLDAVLGVVGFVFIHAFPPSICEGFLWPISVSKGIRIFFPLHDDR